jgi:hypothetical protein
MVKHRTHAEQPVIGIEAQPCDRHPEQLRELKIRRK